MQEGRRWCNSKWYQISNRLYFNTPITSPLPPIQKYILSLDSVNISYFKICHIWDAYHRNSLRSYASYVLYFTFSWRINLTRYHKKKAQEKWDPFLYFFINPKCQNMPTSLLSRLHFNIRRLVMQFLKYNKIGLLKNQGINFLKETLSNRRRKPGTPSNILIRGGGRSYIVLRNSKITGFIIKEVLFKLLQQSKYKWLGSVIKMLWASKFCWDES